MTFASGTTGRLILPHSLSYTGTISGFGLANSPSAGIDLADLVFSTVPNTVKVVSYTPDDPNHNTSGELVVTDGTNSASLHFLGKYTAANFTLHDDKKGGVLIKDPPTAAPSSGDATTVANRIIFGSVAALFGNYMASSFPAAGNGQGGTVAANDGSHTASLQPLLTSPHV